MTFSPVMTLAPMSILLLCLATQVQLAFLIRPPVKNNDRPIIGILAQELSSRMTKIYGDEKYHSYLAASYVKFVESAGARVVPIWIGQPPLYYENILKEVNGVLLPGGNLLFNTPKGYAKAAESIYKIAKKMNDNGEYFPIWGTSLGFQLLTYLEANLVEHRINCSNTNQVSPLIFKPDVKKTRIFENAPTDVIDILKKEDVTYNFHRSCVTERDLTRVNLKKAFTVTSVNRDKNGLEFISSLEHVKYPFYGVQFHPEKNSYEWNEKLIIPHTRNSIHVGQYFADFFVNEARKNAHRFSSPTKEMENLIYNYAPIYTGNQPESSFEQIYLFEREPSENRRKSY